VPELAGFWLLTILLQLPLQGFLLFNEDLILLPMERAANGLMVVLILIQLITGFVALRKITQHQEKIIKKIFTICSKF
jgi:transmembrane protein 17